ncbi:MAG: hypothetical protein Q8S73_21365 [Deltaproteobacteria bacterium]|nr:hypothetical protein [Deltaproteobacteria bacterium]
MMDKDLSIQTVSVEIKVVRVGGHKMTLSTFKQIPKIEYEAICEGRAQILGWVKYPPAWPKPWWVLCVVDGHLFKACYNEDKYGAVLPGDQVYISI